MVKYDEADLEVRLILFTILGSLVCISSSVSILVFCSKDLRAKYVMFLALCFGDLANGLAFLFAGVFRILLMKQGEFFITTTSVRCFFHTPWAILMIFSGQFPALINMFIAVQRVVGLRYATYYRHHWKKEYNYYLILFGVFLSVLRRPIDCSGSHAVVNDTNVLWTAKIMFILFALFINLINPRVNSTSMCSVMQTTGIIYGTIHYALIAFVYISCFIVLYAIFNKMNRTRIPSKDELRRQRMLLTITGVSVVLASIPDFVVMLNEWEIPRIDDLIVGVAYCCFAVHSGLSLIIYLTFRPDFRHQFLKIFPIDTTSCHTRNAEVKSISKNCVTAM